MMSYEGSSKICFAHPALYAGLCGRAPVAGFSASDLDVVLLFLALPDGAWRETTEFEGQIIEAVAHDPRYTEILLPRG